MSLKLHLLTIERLVYSREYVYLLLECQRVIDSLRMNKYNLPDSIVDELLVWTHSLYEQTHFIIRSQSELEWSFKRLSCFSDLIV